ncbi:MAG: hypothetical protein Q7R85_03665 [bacterium]|nr:hypothetical protein [bacterium]
MVQQSLLVDGFFVGMIALGGLTVFSALLYVLWRFTSVSIVAAAKRLRGRFGGCAASVGAIIAFVVGTTAVVFFFPFVLILRAMKYMETTNGNVWAFRVLFGGGVALAAIGAALTFSAIRH